MTSTRDIEAVAPARLKRVVAYNLGLVDLFAAQLLQTERAALSVSPITRRLMLNALMHYRRALDGDGEDVGVPIVEEPSVHPLLEDHMRERAQYLRAENVAQQSRDQGRALGRAERQGEIDKLQGKIGQLVDEVDRVKAPRRKRAK